MLSELEPDKVCFLIVKFREFGVQAEPNLGGGSDATDDKFVAVFDNEAEPSVVKEAEGLIAGMSVEEQQELIALSLVGRGDYSKEEWTDAMTAAAVGANELVDALLLGKACRLQLVLCLGLVVTLGACGAGGACAHGPKQRALAEVGGWLVGWRAMRLGLQICKILAPAGVDGVWIF